MAGIVYLGLSLKPQIEAMMPKMEEFSDPVAINALRDEMLTIDLPPDLQPEKGGKFSFAGMVGMKNVQYKNADNSMTFMVFEVGISDPSGGKGNIKFDEIEKEMKKEIPDNEGQEIETVKITVEGKEREFMISRGKKNDQDDKSFSIHGMLESKQGHEAKAITIVITSSNENLTEEDAIKMIESIKTK